MGAVAKTKNMISSAIQIFNVQPAEDNPMFSVGKARILYTGINRNNSNISETSVIGALPTLAGTPIVGEYLPETDNFGGHGGKVVIQDNKAQYIDTTSAYGFVSENSKFYWEKVVEKDGTVRDYLVADEVKFWTGRYPQLRTLLEQGTYNQSMEIEVTDGQFEEIDGETVFNIKSFMFTALCILGVAKGDDFSGEVEPCFESASIMMYSKQDNSLKQQLAEMMKDLQFSNKEGGKNVSKQKDNKELLFTQRQISELLSSELVKNVFTKDEKETPKFEYVDHTNEKVIFADLEDGKHYVAEFSAVEDKVEIKLDSKEEYELTFTPAENPLKTKVEEFEAKVEEFTKTNSDLTEKLETANTLLTEKTTSISNFEKEIQKFEAQVAEFLKREEAQKGIVDTQAEELRDLREFKRNTEIEGIKEKFSKKIESETLEKILEENSTATVAELESLVFMEIGKQNFSFIKDENEQNDIHLFEEGQKTTGKYDSLINNYLAKKQ